MSTRGQLRCGKLGVGRSYKGSGVWEGLAWVESGPRFRGGGGNFVAESLWSWRGLKGLVAMGSDPRVRGGGEGFML